MSTNNKDDNLAAVAAKATTILFTVHSVSSNECESKDNEQRGIMMVTTS